MSVKGKQLSIPEIHDGTDITNIMFLNHFKSNNIVTIEFKRMNRDSSTVRIIYEGFLKNRYRQNAWMITEGNIILSDGCNKIFPNI